MTNTDPNAPAEMKRGKVSLAYWGTKFFESLGVLNKGSADLAAGDVKQTDAAETLSVLPPALNVTRVGGVAALIASAGAAALAIFNVDKESDSTGIVAAAYGSAGLIVAASLVAVAVIMHADIRARSAPATESAAATGSTATASTPSKQDTATAKGEFKGSWLAAVERLTTMTGGLPQASNQRLEYAKLWREASSTTGMVSGLSPESDLRDDHSGLLAAQGRTIELLKKLIDDHSKQVEDVGEIQDHVRSMRATVNNIS